MQKDEEDFKILYQELISQYELSPEEAGFLLKCILDYIRDMMDEEGE